MKCGCRDVVRSEIPFSDTLEHDGQSYRITLDEAKVYFCKSCGNTILEDATVDELYARMRTIAGLLQPQDIVAIRTKYSLTKNDFSRYLGIAEATLSRWEMGAQIQQKSFDKILRAFDVVPQFRVHLSNGEISNSNNMTPVNSIPTIPTPASRIA